MSSRWLNAVAIVLLLLSLCCSALSFPFFDGQQILHLEKESVAHADSILNVRDELKKAEIIPTVLDDFIPSWTLTIAWPYKNNPKNPHNVTTKLGNTIKPSKLSRPPNAYIEGDPSSTSKDDLPPFEIVLTLTDPDAPSRDDPKWSEMCHWIVSTRGNASTTKEIVEYKPPGPPKKTGKHRYVFTVWKPANSTSDDLNLVKPKDRQHWGYDPDTDAPAASPGRVGVRTWAGEMGLMPIGQSLHQESQSPSLLTFS